MTRHLGLFGLCALAVCHLCQGAEIKAGSGDVTVRCLTVGKKVIPVFAQCGHLWIFNIKPPDLVLINNSKDPVKVGEVVLTAMAAGREVVRTTILTEVISAAMEQVHAQWRAKLGDGPLGTVMEPMLATGLGEMNFGGARLADGATVKPGECGIIMLSQLQFLSHTGAMKLEGLKISVAVEERGKPQTLEPPVPYVAYECKGRYRFPLGGDCTLVCMPMNVTQHRKALSQEFAIDVLDAGPAVDGVLSGARAPSPSKLEDYAIYHRSVMAVGDGTVMTTGNRYPDAVQANPASLSLAEIDRLMEKSIPKLGFLHALAGNYIVIDHGNGEFSFYAHLAENTITVKPGDTVRKGDIIAAVGNTGRSTEPHLHFQMMDGPNFLEANGLPVMFDGIPPNVMNDNYTAANTLMGSDHICLRAE